MPGFLGLSFLSLLHHHIGGRKYGEKVDSNILVTSLERIDFRYFLISSIHSDFGIIVEGINKPIQQNIIQLELFSHC